MKFEVGEISSDETANIVREHMQLLFGDDWEAEGPDELHRKSAAMRLTRAIFRYGKDCAALGI